jgi:general stress protein YciG
MSTKVSQVDRANNHEDRTPQNGAARAPPQPMREADLTPDRPPLLNETGHETKPKRPRGFATMAPTLVKEIARKGGKAAHSAGTAHEFTSEEARIAGRKGGLASQVRWRKTMDDGQPESHPTERAPHRK